MSSRAWANSSCFLIAVVSLLAASSAVWPQVGVSSSSATAATSEGGAELVAAWPPLTRNAARALMEKYGPPDETTPSLLVWYRRKSWSRVAVYRDGPEDDFPFPHHDFVENRVAYDVPAWKATSLLKFDGSLLIDIPGKMLASRSDSEEANILALNLADEIVNGRRSVGSARSEMRGSMEKMAAGKTSTYVDGLLFVPLGASASSSNP